MSFVWKDKVVIVTGSSIGIGRAMAIELGKRGAKVVVNARNVARLSTSVEEMRQLQQGTYLDIAGDVSLVEDCKAIIATTVETFGRLDVLINNAGLSTEGTIEALEPAVFRKLIEVNLLGCAYMTHFAMPHLKKQGGNILYIGSASGIHGMAKYAPYAASKMGLIGLAESVRMEVDHLGVKVGIAYVGFTENDPQKQIYNSQGDIIAQPDRSFVKQEPVEVVAHRLLRMVEKGTFKKVFTSLGRLFYYVNRISPSLVHAILGRRFRKNG